MFPFLVLLPLVLPFATALPADNSTAYYSGLHQALADASLTHFWNALAVANVTESGRALLEGLYSNDEFTIYAPVNPAWESSKLTQPPANGDLVSLLAYHIVQATLNSSTDIAPSRRHTIAFTELRSPTVDLPGDQTQVMVLQTAEDEATGGSVRGEILIRGDSWNASSIGEQFVYANLLFQPIDKLLSVPSPLIKALSQSGLALSANTGATSAVSLIQGLGLEQRFSECHGCTFFVPVNRAYEAASNETSSLSEDEQRAVLLNHVLNGTVVYSPSLSSGQAYITATGTPLIYLSSEEEGRGGSVVSVGKYRASIIRSDIPVSNGVVHLIDTLMVSTLNNADRANEAVESAASEAESRTTTRSVIGVGSSFPTTTTATTTATESTWSAAPTQTGSKSGGMSTVEFLSASKMGVVALVFGFIWL